VSLNAVLVSRGGCGGRLAQPAPANRINTRPKPASCLFPAASHETFRLRRQRII
jgi:hypothetical protein